MPEHQSNLSRRQFLQTAGAVGAGAAAFHIVPAHVLGGTHGTPPSEQIRLAGIGVGGRGFRDLHNLSRIDGCRVTALCDVDWKKAGKALKKYPKAKQFTDFRTMFDEAADQFDAVLLATPDHTHAVIAARTMRGNKALYCEKPLTHSVNEGRTLAELAEKKDVTTQLGNHGHSTERTRMVVEWIRDGAIGEVKEVHAWNRRYKQIYTYVDKLGELGRYHPVPKQLHYDLWLGPATPMPYNPMWCHFTWRGWTPFGNGDVADWWCHVLDPAYWALGLGYPESVKAEVVGYDPDQHGLTFPPTARITYQYPANDKRGPIKVVWHEGYVDRLPEAKQIERPPMLGEDRKIPDSGAVIYGEKAAIMHGPHGAESARLIPEKKMKAYAPKMPEPTIPRAPGGNHWKDWIAAIREGRKAGSDIADYGARLSEGGLLGSIAIRFPGQTLQYDAEARQFTNVKEANQYLERTYRGGWSLGG